MIERIRQPAEPTHSKIRRWMRLNVDRHATANDLCRAAQVVVDFPVQWLDDEFHWIHDEAFALMHQMSVTEATRLWSKTREHPCGAIAAHGGRSTEQDQQTDRELIAYLQAKGYSITRVGAAYLENSGDSAVAYFVCDGRSHDDHSRLEADLQKLAIQLDLDSILIIPCGGSDTLLLGTTRGAASPGFGERLLVDASSSTASGRFLTLLHGELPSREIPAPQSRHGRWGQHLLATRLEQRWQSAN
jgi:hypothetical protein